MIPICHFFYLSEDQLNDNQRMYSSVVIPHYNHQSDVQLNNFSKCASDMSLKKELCLFLSANDVKAISYRTFFFERANDDCESYVINTLRSDVLIIGEPFTVHRSDDFDVWRKSICRQDDQMPCEQIIHFILSYKSPINEKLEHITSQNYQFCVHKKIFWKKRVCLIFICICTFGFILFSLNFRQKLFSGEDNVIYDYDVKNNLKHLFIIPQKHVSISLIEKLENGELRTLLSRHAMKETEM